MAAKKKYKIKAQNRLARSAKKSTVVKRGGFFVGQEQLIVFVKGLSAIMICFALLWSFSGAFAQSADDVGVVKKPFYARAIDWARNSVKSVTNWVEKTSSKLAKAILGTTNGLSTGQVLGESLDIPPIDESPPSTSSADREPFVVPLSAYNTLLVSQSPAIINSNPGIDHTVSVTYSNTGEVSWENQAISLNLFTTSELSQLEHTQWITSKRPVVNSSTVIPGDDYQFNFLISAPNTPGEYELVIRPVVFAEGAFNWLGDSSNLVRWRMLVQEPEPVQNPAEEVGGDIEFIEPPAEIVDEVQEPEIVPEDEAVQEEIIEGEVVEAEESPAQNQPSSLPFPVLASDRIAPTSEVTALAATTTTANFDVAWTGQDNRNSDMFYDVQYQVDSGDWTAWLTETVLLTSSFTTAVDESIYGFRTRGKDSQGNWEDYPDTADTSTYMNLSVPTDPVVTSHTSGDTIFQSADEDSGVTDVQVTLSGTGDANDTLVISLDETSTTATTTVGVGGTWSQQFTLAEDTNTFSLQSTEADGDSSSSVAFTLELTIIPTFDVVINEIAWMGTAADSSDEWIELYNASSTAITLTNWTLSANDGTPNITLSGSIAAKSYYVLERTASTTISDVTEDLIYSGALGDGGELLSLRDSSSTLIDRVGSTTVAWFAGNSGTKVTMERKDPTTSGTESSNWADNDESLVNGSDSGSTALKATPGSLNSVNTTIPRTITDLTFQYIYTTSTSVKMYWTAPKIGNLSTTTPATYDARYSTSAITDANFASATELTGELTPSVTQGTIQTLTANGLTANTEYYFAVKTNNGVEDSLTSTSPNITTLQAGGGSYTTIAGYPSGTGGLLASSSSPYLLTASFAIANGNTLTIEPGTVVKVSGNRTITVNGNIVMGDADDAINAAVFTSVNDDSYGGVAAASSGSPAAGDWGVLGTGAATASFDFDNAIIRYGGNSASMIAITSGITANIANSILEYSNNNIMSVATDATSFTLTDSIIRGGGALPIPAGIDGIGVSSLANINITGTTFTNNQRGIAIDTSADEANITLSGNNFFGNNRVTGGDNAGLQVSDTDGTPVVATGNWWGVSTGPTLDTHSTADDIDGVLDDNDGSLSATNIDVSTFSTTQFEIKPSSL